MIKITRPNLDKIAAQHKKRICDNRGRAKGLTHRLLQAIVDEKSRVKKAFYREILADINQPDGQCLLTSLPDQLAARAQYYSQKYAATLTTTFIERVNEKIFFYKSYEKWGAYELAADLGMNVCPYCNRQYTFTLKRQGPGTRPQFDHFFAKATHPYLSLSFYNLIPCCSICNASLKGSLPFTLTSHLHPYLHGFSQHTKFRISPTCVNFINGRAENYSIDLYVNPSLDAALQACIRGNIAAFALLDLYNMHKDYVDEIILKARIYDKNYVESIYRQFQGTLFSDINDVKRMIFANFYLEADHEKRVLAKLTADICDDLGLSF